MIRPSHRLASLLSATAAAALLAACSQPASHATVDLSGSQRTAAYSSAGTGPVYQSTQTLTALPQSRFETPQAPNYEYSAPQALPQQRVAYYAAPTQPQFTQQPQFVQQQQQQYTQVVSLDPTIGLESISTRPQFSAPVAYTAPLAAQDAYVQSGEVLPSFEQAAQIPSFQTALAVPGPGSIGAIPPALAIAAPQDPFAEQPLPQFEVVNPDIIDQAPLSAPSISAPAISQPSIPAPQLFERAEIPALPAPVHSDEPIVKAPRVTDDYVSLSEDTADGAQSYLDDTFDDYVSFADETQAEFVSFAEETKAFAGESLAETEAPRLTVAPRDPFADLLEGPSAVAPRATAPAEPAPAETQLALAPRITTPPVFTAPAPQVSRAEPRAPFGTGSSYARPFSALRPGIYPEDEAGGPAIAAVSPAPPPTPAPKPVYVQVASPLETLAPDQWVDLAAAEDTRAQPILTSAPMPPERIERIERVEQVQPIETTDTRDPWADIAAAEAARSQLPVLVAPTPPTSVAQFESEASLPDSVWIDMADLPKSALPQSGFTDVLSATAVDSVPTILSRSPVPVPAPLSAPVVAAVDPTEGLDDAPIVILGPSINNKPEFSWPLHGEVFRLRDGQIKIVGQPGKFVSSPAAGTVVLVENGPQGALVVMEHEGGWRSLALGLTAPEVEPGQTITKGALLGYVGRSGTVHFELRDGSSRIAEVLQHLGRV